MERISRGFRLAGQSWQVVKADKELVGLAAVSLVAAAVAMGVVALAYIVITPGGLSDDSSFGAVEGVFSIAGAVAVTYIGQFTLAAIVGAASIRLKGGDPTVRDGLQMASKRAGAIFAWTLLTVTVGLVLRAVRERAGFLGDLLSFIAEAAWAVLTFMVVPVIVHEGLGPWESVKRSSQIFKDRWGEQLVGEGTIGIAVFLVGVLVIGPTILLGSVLLPVAIVLVVIEVILLMSVSTALSGVFRAALYEYAVKGESVGPFAAADLAGQFHPRRGARGPGMAGGFAGPLQ